jgi:hypothetical protein
LRYLLGEVEAMTVSEITKDTSVADGPSEPLAFFAAVHQANVDELLREITAEIENLSAAYVYKETLQDYIYRRFFKVGIATVLSVGCLWGAINLLQIALGKSFLQLRLLSSIHAHAHAMIFGWVAMFVMGFAYQSFPRFKNTTLWRPDLANLSFYLLAAGIVAGMAADLLLPDTASFFLGAFSGVFEISSVAIFMFVLYRTARQSIEPHNPYEKFIASSFLWLLLGTVLEAVFFFAKATARLEHELIMRIALIDGPLRDIQLLGFAALIIAGGEPALCAAGVWTGSARTGQPGADFLGDEWQPGSEHHQLRAAAHNPQTLFRNRPRSSIFAYAGLGSAVGTANWSVRRAIAAGSHLQIRPRGVRLVADLLRHDAIFPALWGADPPGVRTHLHGFPPARIHRGFHQHDDPGSFLASRADSRRD